MIAKLFLLGLLSLSYAIRPAVVEFNNFVDQYGKKYSADEYDLRFEIFKFNLDRIQKHNAKNLSWRMESNAFMDLTWDEFRQSRLGFGTRQTRLSGFERIPHLTDNAIRRTDLPSEVDWRKKGVVNPVKDQGQCGSCWAFSAISSIESNNAIKTGKLYSLSEQQLVDCSGSYGDQGCNGGLMDDAFQYAEKNALCSEDDYSYTAQDGTCKKTCKGLVKVQSFVDIPAGDENALQTAVASHVVSIAIEADQSGFQFYSGGVFDGECGQNLDHGVTLEGYGSEDGKPYWLVRNSWGSSWGTEGGYIKLVRGKNQCGISNAASYPVV
jgi:C1A family cysteine protease